MHKAVRILRAALSLTLMLACLCASAHADERPKAAPLEIDTLYIGLSFGQGAVGEVVLSNPDGLGFSLGHMDEKRCFVEQERCGASELHIRRETYWYMLMDKAYATEEAARAEVLVSTGRIVQKDGSFRIAYGPYATVGEVMALLRAGWTDAQAWSESSLAVYDGQGRLQRVFSETDTLALRAISASEPGTSYQGRLYRGAFLLRCGDDARFTVVNAVGLEDYVKGVVPYEMSAGWPIEALKAQAICARTYGAYHVNAYAEEYGFDLTNDTQCQVYRGLNGADAVTDLAVDSTRGQCVRYQGELCEIYYFSSDGGATEDGVNIFGSDRPYLKGVEDPYEAAMDKYVLRWERRITGEQIAERLRELEHEIGTVTRVTPGYSAMGNVISMRYEDREGRSVTLERRDSYSLLALDSARFTVKEEDGVFVFTGVGWGHNCGMSQWGAYAMADTYGMSAAEIIEFYFTGACIE